MKQPSDQPRPSLEDLFVLKRAERPSPEFWDEFQREFHVRQRAAAIEPKRWWFVLPRVLSGLSRYQMPMGAAAVLAVTFLSFREYREPGLEVAFAPGSPMQSEVSRRAFTTEAPPEAASVARPNLDEPMTVAPRQREPEEVTEIATVAEPMPLSPMVVWAGVAAGRADPASSEASPSARSIAANLAAVRAEQPEMVRLMGEPRINLTATSRTAEPLTMVAASAGSARAPLFAYQPAGSGQRDNDELANEPDVHSRIASRLSDELLYDSVRRLTAGGDRLTLKF